MHKARRHKGTAQSMLSVLLCALVAANFGNVIESATKKPPLA
jgi:hypothetical protein